MGIGSIFFKRREKVQKQRDSALRAQVASAIHTFLSIRGLRSLLQPETALVMRKEQETFVTQDADRIENRDTVVAVVYLKDVECYGQFKEIQEDYSLRSGALGPVILGQLADQVATQLVKQVAEVAEKPRGLQFVGTNAVGEIIIKRT